MEPTMNKDTNKRVLRISFVIPQPFEGSGGHRNIFRTVKFLSRFGHKLAVYVNPDNDRFKTSAEVEDFITANFFDLTANIIWQADKIEKCDVLFATHWTTAYIVDKNRDKAKLCCYFIQDFEPYFYSMSYDYIVSYNTYKLGLYPITSGPWPLKLIQRHFDIHGGDYFRFPIDKSIYYKHSEEKNYAHKRIVFFARPDMPRRCYNLGVEGLAIVKAMRPDVEIIFYGAKSNSYVNIPFNFTNLGIVPEISQLGNLYRSADVGICFSTTNPSLVPYEMMACGCPVVDLNFNDNAINYGGKENVMLVGPTEREIAEGILYLLEDCQLSKTIIANGLEYCNSFPDEEEMVRMIERIILNQFAKKT